MTAPHELLRQVDESLCSPDKWLRLGESDERGAVLDVALHGDQLSKRLLRCRGIAVRAESLAQLLRCLGMILRLAGLAGQRRHNRVLRTDSGMDRIPSGWRRALQIEIVLSRVEILLRLLGGSSGPGSGSPCSSRRRPAPARHLADQRDPVPEDCGNDRLPVLWSEFELFAGEVEDVAVVTEPLMHLLLQVGSRVPCCGGNHDEVDVATYVGIPAGDRSEHDHSLDLSRSLAHDASQHLDRADQRAQGSDGRVALVDVVYAGTPDGLGRDQPKAIQVSERLLHSAQAVAICDQRVHPSSCQWRARAKHHCERRATRAGHQATERFAEVHMSKILALVTLPWVLERV